MGNFLVGITVKFLECQEQISNQLYDMSTGGEATMSLLDKVVSANKAKNPIQQPAGTIESALKAVSSLQELPGPSLERTINWVETCLTPVLAEPTPGSSTHTPSSGRKPRKIWSQTENLQFADDFLLEIEMCSCTRQKTHKDGNM